ncbi:MarR family winged helix-turn-helix transcriptional regulator [Botrimarina mediterranea]|uniref:Transcriptional regulator SlyA n=2 Tax=Botrimarina mediterranea TaxID=2528022 RepID=A0A518KAI7_9BACT|nr:MarR family transcriptional regulator [Botrimarina mediterranea]QDV74807.1 Transcriptional regulator SlyA [Botrimarina mediterranea]QDV79451.1 Transcriptional regulator SlyA [Planctomycetes bacterium K2D]
MSNNSISNHSASSNIGVELLKHNFQSDAGYWVHVCAHRFELHMNALLADEGISYRQMQVLAWLAMEGDQSQADLSRCMGVEPPTVVSVIDRMERDGLIERKACPDDRRKRIISPTERALPVWERIIGCAKRINQRATKGLTKSEIATLRSLLERVHTNLEGD